MFIYGKRRILSGDIFRTRSGFLIRDSSDLHYDLILGGDIPTLEGNRVVLFRFMFPPNFLLIVLKARSFRARAHAYKKITQLCRFLVLIDDYVANGLLLIG